jgi:hypothetical protein
MSKLMWYISSNTHVSYNPNKPLLYSTPQGLVDHFFQFYPLMISVFPFQICEVGGLVIHKGT